MLPLKGTVVLDFCHNRPGSYATMFLGDFGAEVIRVDPPVGAIEQLDNLESGGAHSPERYAAHCVIDRNKKSIIVNMKHKQGQDVLHRLAKKADVLVEGFKPGVMNRLKADYATLK